MIANEIVELSRLQFALTALYHFLFVPLTLGLSFLLAIMESMYIMLRLVFYGIPAPAAIPCSCCFPPPR